MPTVQEIVKLVAVTVGAGAVFAMGAATGGNVTITGSDAGTATQVTYTGQGTRYRVANERVTVRPKHMSSTSVEVDALGNTTFNSNPGPF